MAESKKTVVFGNTKGNLKEITKATRDYWKDSPETNVGENIGPNYRNKETEADTVDRLSFPTQDNKEEMAREKGINQAKNDSTKYQPNFKKGGSVKSSASSRGDGIATKGKTKGRIC